MNPDTRRGSADEPPPAWAERRVPALRTLLHGLDDGRRSEVLNLAVQNQRYAPGECIYAAGSPVSMLYAVQSGEAKSLIGPHRMAGYYLQGELFGFAGLAAGAHVDDAVACDTVDVAAMPYLELARLARDVPTLHRSLSRVLAVRLAPVSQRPGSPADGDAHALVAHFLLQLGERWSVHGQPARQFPLHVSNAEVGSLLGLPVDAVDEALARLTRDGQIDRVGRTVLLLDLVALRRAANPVRTFGWGAPGKGVH